MSNKVVEILKRRDGLTTQEAEERVEEVREILSECDPYEADDILMDELGLEMDYIFDILF